MNGIDALTEQLKNLDIRRNVLMSELVTFRIGGPADAVLFPSHEEDICRAMDAAKTLSIPVFVMGRGSNLLVRDKGIRGLVICIGNQLGSIVQHENALTVGAGRSLTSLAQEALKRGLMGLEWACGIPGTVGGACAMNAGAYGGDIKQVLRSVRAIREGKIVTISVSEQDLGYRKSVFCAPDCTVLQATLELMPDDGHAAERQAEYLRKRQEKQPLSYPSAGSVFKRPEGHFAGALIEQAGLKGARVGGAMVSTLHAGFIINDRQASADDVCQLIAKIQHTVQEQFGVSLECEVKIIGEE